MELVITKVKGCTKSLQVVQTSCAWRTDSTQYLTITFQSFANGKRLATETLLPKFIQNLFTYAEGFKVRVSLYFAK